MQKAGFFRGTLSGGTCPKPRGVQGHQLPPPSGSRPCGGKSPGLGAVAAAFLPDGVPRAHAALSPGSAGTPSSSGRPCTTGPAAPGRRPSGTSWRHHAASWGGPRGDTGRCQAALRAALPPHTCPGPSPRTHLGLAPSLEGRAGTQVLTGAGCGSRRMGARQP